MDAPLVVVQANGDSLVTLVVPYALLVQSRQNMRAAFSAVIMKRVYVACAFLCCSCVCFGAARARARHVIVVCGCACCAPDAGAQVHTHV